MAVRPAFETLRALQNGKTLNALALKINEACEAVKENNKAAKVILEITVNPYTGKGTKLVDHPVVMTAKVTTKLPEPEKEASIFFLDADNNPVLTPEREDEGLPLSIAGAVSNGR